MSLHDVLGGIADFAEWEHNDKIKLFAWYLHTVDGKERFSAREIKQCYDDVDLEKPANVYTSLERLRKKSPKQVLRDRKGYSLEWNVRRELDAKYGMRPTTYRIHQDLQALSAKIPDVNERQFLNETIICLKNGAPRAAIVMGWNLAYDHLCNFIVAKHLADFNTALPLRFPKNPPKALTKREDFAELKESEVLDVARLGSITSDNLHKLLKEKLVKRNTAAHPNELEFTILSAEAFVNELVNNVVLILL